MWKSDSSRLQVIHFMKEQVSLGKQIYIVFPLIEESEKLDYKDLMEGYNSIEEISSTRISSKCSSWSYES